jgi:hypothetical protein
MSNAPSIRPFISSFSRTRSPDGAQPNALVINPDSRTKKPQRRVQMLSGVGPPSRSRPKRLTPPHDPHARTTTTGSWPASDSLLSSSAPTTARSAGRCALRERVGDTALDSPRAAWSAVRYARSTRPGGRYRSGR